ncbi:MAG TPA: four helix bundle protein [Polyangiaceae bacterium]|nr:four helix bundle protein [Polyangiaceae bacterium]
MLRIYPVILAVLKELQPVLRRIEARDRDLGRQLRRCSTSIALNVAEGMYSRGQNRNARYHSALGSARETLACLEVAEVCGHIGSASTELQHGLNHVIGTLVRLVRA